MQPYRNVTPNRIMPIYWPDCQQCSCENCISRDTNQNELSPPVPDEETRRPSFTIESLLSRKDQRKSTVAKPCLGRASMALVSSGNGQFAHDRPSELIHGSGYLTNFRRPGFGFDQVSLLARGNIQTNGRLKIVFAECLWRIQKELNFRLARVNLKPYRAKGLSFAIFLRSLIDNSSNPLTVARVQWKCGKL